MAIDNERPTPVLEYRQPEDNPAFVTRGTRIMAGVASVVLLVSAIGLWWQGGHLYIDRAYGPAIMVALASSGFCFTIALGVIKTRGRKRP